MQNIQVRHLFYKRHKINWKVENKFSYFLFEFIRFGHCLINFHRETKEKTNPNKTKQKDRYMYIKVSYKSLTVAKRIGSQTMMKFCIFFRRRVCLGLSVYFQSHHVTKCLMSLDLVTQKGRGTSVPKKNISVVRTYRVNDIHNSNCIYCEPSTVTILGSFT